MKNVTDFRKTVESGVDLSLLLVCCLPNTALLQCCKLLAYRDDLHLDQPNQPHLLVMVM